MSSTSSETNPRNLNFGNIPIFSGLEGNAAQWLDCFDYHAKVYSWSETETMLVLPTRLSSRAIMWYQLFVDSTKEKSWTNAKKSFKEHLNVELNASTAYRRLRDLLQEPQEFVRSFLARFNMLASILKDIPKRHIAEIFIDGLLPIFKESIRGNLKDDLDFIKVADIAIKHEEYMPNFSKPTAVARLVEQTPEIIFCCIDTDYKIGGRGRIVEINECLLVKNKYLNYQASSEYLEESIVTIGHLFT